MNSRSKAKKLGADTGKGGGVTGAIVPAQKPVDKFPLMSYVAKNCSFVDDLKDDYLLHEEVLRAENDRRTEELLNQAAQAAQSHLSRDSSDDERKKALEVLRSLEYARNQEDTWKISKPVPKTEPNYGGFLHPLKRNDKEDEYFSGTRKVKQQRERKRSRSDEVVLLEEGKLISKSGEPSQLPIKFTHPSSSPRPRIPSVGLPFTRAPSPPVENSVWYQKSGADLFSEAQSSTIIAYGVQCDEEEALARAIAESIRTAKQDQQRINIRDMYNNQCAASVSVFKPEDDKPFVRLPPDPPGTSWEDDSTEPPTQTLWTQSKDSKERGASKKIERSGNNGSLQQRSIYDDKKTNIKSYESMESPVGHLSKVTDEPQELEWKTENKKRWQPEPQDESAVDHTSNDVNKSGRYDDKENHVKSDKSLKSPMGHLSKEKSESKKISQPEPEKESAEIRAEKLNDDLYQKKSGLCVTDCLEQSESSQVIQNSSLSAPRSQHLAFQSASNKTSPKIFGPQERESKMKLTSDCQPPEKEKSHVQSKDISDNNTISSRYGSCTDDEDGNECSERSTRLSRNLSNTFSTSRWTEAAAEINKPSSSRLPTSIPPLMSAMKTHRTTEAEITDSDVHPAFTPKPSHNQKQVADHDGKSEISSSTNNYSSSQCIKATDGNMNEIKMQQVHASKVPNPLKKKMGPNVSSCPDQNLNEIQLLLMQQALGGFPPVLQDGQNRSSVTASTGLNLNESNERTQKTQVSAFNHSNTIHSSSGGLPEASESALPYMLGHANASANGLSGFTSAFSATPHSTPKESTSRATSSLSEFSSTQTSAVPSVSTNAVTPASYTGMPEVPKNLSNVISFPGGIPGMENLIPNAHLGLPGFHTAGSLPGMPTGSLNGQPNNTNLFVPLPGGVPGMPNLLPAQLSGMPNPFLGAFSGLPNVFPGMPGLVNNMSGVPNFLSGGLGGLQSSTPLNVQNLQGQMPTVTAGSVDPFFASLPNFPGGLPFGNFSNACGAVPPMSTYSSGIGFGEPPQPGSAPLVTGKGRGRLARGLHA